MSRASTISRVLAAIWVLSTVVWTFWSQKGYVGFIAYTSNGVHHVAAGTTPIALALAVVGIGLFCALVRTELHIGDFRIAPLWRRYVAFLMDFWLCAFIWGTLSAMVPLLLETRRAGTFQWDFERDYAVHSDGIYVTLLIIYFIILVAYFVLTLANCRQTIGSWLLRITTVNADGSAVYLPLSTALRWSYREFAELGSPSTLWKIVRGRDAHDATWYDREEGLRVVRY